MTAVDTLREVAALMRHRAQAATPGPWRALTTGVRGGNHWYVCNEGDALAYIAADDGVNEAQRQPDAEHIASWPPNVALAVADWLDGVAERHRPRQNSSGLPDACPACLGGIFVADPEQPRDCGCRGLSEPICGTCSQDGSAVRRYPQFWPCRDVQDALAVARAYLGGAS